MIHYSIDEDSNCHEHVEYIEEEQKYKFFYPCDSSTECKPYTVLLQRGVYRFELWGAQGGDGRIQNTANINYGTGGRGAYVSGDISLSSFMNLYLYIGGKGEDQVGTSHGEYGIGGYNGGGNGGADLCDSWNGESNGGGGGATDIRLIYNENFADTISLKSRIIVAAGGGSACSTTVNHCVYSTETSSDYLCTNPNIYSELRGGPGGALFGYRYNVAVYPGNQTNGSFGIGTNGISLETYTVNDATYWGGSTGGGGGGYFGGTSITENPYIQGYVQAGGAGGSSYVSGCYGCRSVEFNPLDQVKTTNKKAHYSGLIFDNIKMLSGIESFPSPTGEVETGHSGNGHITITYLHDFIPVSCHKNINKCMNFKVYITIFIIIS